MVRILIFTPSSNLLPGTTYWVKIKSTATDLEGYSLDGDYDGTGGEEGEDDWTMCFTTATTNPPFSHFHSGHWSQIYDKINDDPMGKVRCLAVDSRDRLWLVTKEGSGIYCLDGQTWKERTPSSNNFQISGFPCMTIDHQDRVWVGIDTYPNERSRCSQVSHMGNDTWQTISARTLHLIQDEDIIKIAADSSGNIWMITSGGQILTYRNGQIISHSISDLSDR